MRFDPADPIWPNRDRFVLSNGHASMLLWSMLHLTGVQGGQSGVRSARAASRSRSTTSSASARSAARRRAIPNTTCVSGVETTTGPLGQGIATSVGMAIAQKWLATRYNQPGFPIFDYNIYAICGDGCLMEGVGAEAASLAGHLELDNLCWIYDNNHITIEGNTRIAFTEDVAARFLGYGWNVLRVGDANDLERIEHALDGVQARPSDRPTLIVLDTPHRLRLAAPAGHRRRARRAARRGGSEAHQARLRLAGGRAVPRPRRRARALRGRHRRRAARRRTRSGTSSSRKYRAKYPALADGDRADAEARAARGLGQQPAGVPGRRQGHRRPRRVGQGAERARAEHPVAPRRLGRPRAVEQDHAQVRGRRRVRARLVRRPQPALRHPRARDGRGGERHGAVQAAAVRRDLLHLQRLRARRRSACRR